MRNETLCGRLKTEENPTRVPGGDGAKARKCPQWEEGGIAVIAQVKDPRKPDRGVPGLVPFAVLILARDQVGDAPVDRRVFGLAGGHQAK